MKTIAIGVDNIGQIDRRAGTIESITPPRDPGEGGRINMLESQIQGYKDKANNMFAGAWPALIAAAQEDEAAGLIDDASAFIQTYINKVQAAGLPAYYSAALPEIEGE